MSIAFWIAISILAITYLLIIATFIKLLVELEDE